MSRHGAYGPPYRPPADGWHTPPLTYLGGLYQHQRAALNGLTAYQNTTQVPLQPNQWGAPVTQYSPDMTGGSGCESHGTPTGAPWINPNFPPSSAVNTFTPNGTVNLGENCRQRGFKNVQAVRQWHGCFGWTSHDAGAVADTVCETAVNDCNDNAPGAPGYQPTYSTTAFEAYQPTPDQTKYTTLTVAANYSYTWTNYADSGPGDTYTAPWTQIQKTAGASGSRSVNANSGLITSTLSTTETDYLFNESDSDNLDLLSTVTNGNGYSVEFGSGPPEIHVPIKYGSTVVDADISADVHGLADIPAIASAVTLWNGTKDEWNYLQSPTPTCDLAIIPTSTGGYSITDSYAVYGPERTGSDPFATATLAITVSRSATVYSWDIQISCWTFDGSINNIVLNYTGSLTLSNPNTASSLYTDLKSLLGYWNLADDGQYPPRTDGLWQVAPLMSRDEAQQDVSPVGFNQYYMDDLTSPTVDGTGLAPYTAGWQPTYTQTGWRDPAAWGFSFAPGESPATAAATGLVQFAETGVVLGAPSTAGTQNYFDFRAVIWKACLSAYSGVGEYVDWYIYGWGQWLTDAIAATGAQLPLTATQWTNNWNAYNRPPYAWLVQGDHQVYDQDGTPSPDFDMQPPRPDALWAQKCVEYTDLWPSYNFFRPAGPDKFAYDETTVCCVSGLNTPTTYGFFTSTDYQGNPITLTPPAGSIWGGPAVGGFYDITVSGSTVTLGTKRYSVPSDWTTRSGDAGSCFGMLRFTSDSATVPAIIGRAAVTVSGTTASFTLPQTAFGLNATGTEQVDIYNASMTLLASSVTATRSGSGDSPTQFTTATAYPAAAWVMIHGAPDWCWDDNGRKGDFVYLDWTWNYRLPGEVSRLATATDCSANTPPSGSPSAPVSAYSGFTQTQNAIAFKPCCPMAVCISPNGETFTNGITYPFPPTFAFDDRYGARWQAEIESAMCPSWYQTPHTPCGLSGSWAMDDGTCMTGGDGVTYYAHYPLVEARISVPTNGGYSGTETAPTPPTGIGYLSPVTNVGGLGAPGMIGFDPGSGNPSPAWTFWGYRSNIESTCGGCAFDYADMENLPCVSSYVYTPPAPPADIGTSAGTAGSGGLT